HISRVPTIPPLFPYTTLFRSRPRRVFPSGLARNFAKAFGLVNLWRNGIREATKCPPNVPTTAERTPTPLAIARRSSSGNGTDIRSEEHTSELQSRENLVCRLL